MACIFDKEIVKSIYRLVNREFDSNNINGVITKVWEELSKSFNGNVTIDDKVVFFKTMINSIIQKSFIASNDNSFLQSDMFSDLKAAYNDPKKNKYIKIDKVSKTTTVQSNVPTPPVDVDNLPTGTTDNSNKDKGTGNVVGVVKTTEDFYNLLGQYKDIIPQSLISYLFDNDKFKEDIPYNETLSAIKEICSLISNVSDGKINTIQFLKNLSNVYSKFYNSIVNVSQSPETLLQKLNDEFISKVKLKDDKLIHDNVTKGINDFITNINNGVVAEFDFTNSYSIKVNNAFYDNEYEHSGKHQQLFLAVHTIAQKPSSYRYYSMTASSLYKLMKSNSNYSLLGEFKEMQKDNETTKYDYSELDNQTRSLLNFIAINTDSNDRNIIYDKLKSSDDATIKDVISKYTKDKFSIKSALLRIVTSAVKESKTETIDEVFDILDSINLVFIVPYSDFTNAPETFSYNGSVRNSNDKVDLEKTKVKPYSYITNTRNNTSTSENGRSNSSELIEGAIGIIALPLHSRTKESLDKLNIDGYIVKNDDALNGIIAKTKKKNIYEVGVSFEDGPIGSFEKNNIFIVPTESFNIEKVDGIDHIENIPVKNSITRISTTTNTSEDYVRTVFSVRSLFGQNFIKYDFNNLDTELPEDFVKKINERLNYIMQNKGVKLQLLPTDMQIKLEYIQNILDSNKDNSSLKTHYYSAIGYAILNTSDFYTTKLDNATTLYNYYDVKIENGNEYSNVENKHVVLNNYQGFPILILSKKGVAFITSILKNVSKEFLFKAYVMPECNVFSKYSYDVMKYASESSLGSQTENSISFVSRPHVYIEDNIVSDINDNVVEEQNSIDTTGEIAEVSNAEDTSFRTQERPVDDDDWMQSQSKVYGESLQSLHNDMQEALDWFKKSPLYEFVKIEQTLAYGDREQCATLHRAIEEIGKELLTEDKKKDLLLTIYKGGNYTSLYHENWHILTQFCMTQEERNSLYNELRKLDGTFKEYKEGKRVKFKNATNQQLEELMAESFRHYMMTGKFLIENNLTFVKNGERITIGNFFEKIIAWIKWHLDKFFGVDPAKPAELTPIINSMFEKLKYGNVQEYADRFNKEGAEFFTVDQSLFYADQALLDTISLENLSNTGLETLSNLYYKETENENLSEKELRSKFTEFRNKYKTDENFRNELYEFVRKNNITNSTAGFEKEATYGETEHYMHVEKDGLYGIDENLSTLIMEKLKYLYVAYLKNLKFKDEQDPNKTIEHGFLYKLQRQSSISNFFKWLPIALNNKEYFNTKNRIDNDMLQFISANIDFQGGKSKGMILGIQQPFIEYIQKELQDIPEEELVDEIIDNEDDGEENYDSRNDFKRGDNEKNLKEYIRGQIRFILSLVNKNVNGMSYKQKASAIINRIHNIVDEHSGPEDLFERIFINSDDEYISQIIDIIGYPPIYLDTNTDLERYNRIIGIIGKDEFNRRYKKAKYDYTKTGHEQVDLDRIFAWDMFYLSFCQSKQTPLTSKLTIKDVENRENRFVKSASSESENNDYDEDMPGGGGSYTNNNPDEEIDDEQPIDWQRLRENLKKYYFSFYSDSNNMQDKELRTYISYQQKNHPTETTTTSLIKGGITFDIVSDGVKSKLNVTVVPSACVETIQSSGKYQVKEFNTIKNEIYALSGIKNDKKTAIDNFISFFNAIGITIDKNSMANEVLGKYGVSMVANVITNIYEIAGRYILDDEGKLNFDISKQLSLTIPIGDIFSIVSGNAYKRLSKILKSQIDLFSSFAAYTGEKDLSNEHALHSFMTLMSGVLNNDDFKTIARSGDRYKLIQKFPYLKSFISSPYFDLFYKEGTYLSKILDSGHETKVVRNIGLQIWRQTNPADPKSRKFLNGYVPFEMPKELKVLTDVANSSSYNMYFPIQWADKGPCLSLLLVDNDGHYVNPLGGNIITEKKIYDIFAPYIDAEIQRVRKVKDFYDNPTKYFLGNQYYLLNGQKFSFFDEILNFDEQTLIDLVSSNLSASEYFAKYGLEDTIKNNIKKYFDKELKDYLDGIGDDIKLLKLNEREDSPAIDELARRHVYGSTIMGIIECVLLTGDTNNYDNFSKRNGPIISTGEVHEFNRFLESALNEINSKGLNYTSKVFEEKANSDYIKVRNYDRVIVCDDIIASTIFKDFTRDLIASGTYTKMEIANAIGYITFDSYKHHLQKVGKWTKEQEQLYQKIIALKEISVEDIRRHFPPLKLQVSSSIADGSLDQKVLLKNMYLPLIPTAIKGTGLEQLHNLMMKDEIDVITVKNGSKLNEKTDHQGDLTSLFRFGLISDGITERFNDKVLVNSLRYISIYLSPDKKDVVKDNGRSAIDRLKINGKYYDANGSVVAQTIYKYGKKLSPKEEALQRVDLDGSLSNAVEVIYTDEKINDSDQTVVLRVDRNAEGNIDKLVRCFVDTTSNKLVELNDKQINVNTTYEQNDYNNYMSFMYSDNTNVIISDNSFCVDSKFIRDQLEIHNEEGQTISFYTQLRTMFSMNIYEDGVAINDESEKAANAFEDAFRRLFEYHFQKIVGKICKTIDGKIPLSKDGNPVYKIDIDKVVAFIKKEADMSKDIPQEIYRQLNNETLCDRLHNSIYSSTLLELLVGRLTKDLTKIKVNGDNLKQAPDLLFDNYKEDVYELVKTIVENNSFEHIKVYKPNMKLSERDYKKHLYSNGMTYDSYAENFYQLDKFKKLNPAKAQITFCKDYLLLKDNTIVRNVAEALGKNVDDVHELCQVVNKCLEIKNAVRKDDIVSIDDVFKDKDKKLIEKYVFTDEDMSIFKLVGVRIPTQGYNFMDFMEIGRFVDPALGPIIVLPKEMVEKNGSDYDVDSMPIMMPHVTKYKTYEVKDDGTFNSTTIVELTNIGLQSQIQDELYKIQDAIDILKAERKDIHPRREGYSVYDYIYNKTKGYYKYALKGIDVPIDDIEKVNIFDLTEEQYNSITNNGKNLISLRNIVGFIFNKNQNGKLKWINAEQFSTIDGILGAMYVSNNYKGYKKASEEFVETILFSFDAENDKKQEALNSINSRLKDLYAESRELSNTIKDIELNSLENDLLNSIYNVLRLPCNNKSMLKKSDTHYFTEDGGVKESMYYDLFPLIGETDTDITTIENNDSDNKSVKLIIKGDKESEEKTIVINDVVKYKGKYYIFNGFYFESFKYMTPKEFGSKLNHGMNESEISSMKKVSPSYNEFVRSSNSISKKSLGIAAVSAKWSAEWKRVGLKLKNTFELNGREYKSTFLLGHNTKTIDNIDYISLGKKQTVDNFEVSEILDELVSGFVDGAKDPWPALLNFVTKVVPIVEFMVWSGCRRDDIITLINYPSIRNYIKDLDSFENGIGRYLKKYSSNAERQTKNFFLSTRNDIMNENIIKIYNEKAVKKQKIKMVELAYMVLNNVDTSTFDRGMFIEELWRVRNFDEYKSYSVSNSTKNSLTVKSFQIGTGDNKYTVPEFNISYDDYAILQYLMLEKMSNDITTFTTTFEADKNTYKTIEEMNNYRELLDSVEIQNASVVNYKYLFAKFRNTNLGATFYNDRLSSVLTELMSNDFYPLNSHSWIWRNNPRLETYLCNRLKYVKNGKKLHENIRDAKDKIFEYYFQNNLARREFYNERMTDNETENSIAQQRGGYFVEYDNGVKQYVYNKNMLYNLYIYHRSEFACFDEFKNFLFKRDELLDRYKNVANKIVTRPTSEDFIDANGNTITKKVYKNLRTKLSGDILYDLILKRISVKECYSTVLNGNVYVNEDNVNDVLFEALNTYCYIRSKFEIFNFNTLFRENDAIPTYAELVCSIVNGNIPLQKRFPILANLFRITSYMNSTSLVLTKALDTNYSNDQYGDETTQVMNSLFGKNGVTNTSVLIQALSQNNKNKLTVSEIYNMANSIKWIMSLLGTYSQLQAGNNISGTYGIAKFGDDKYRSNLAKGDVVDLIDKLDDPETIKEATETLDRILKFRPGKILGTPVVEKDISYVERGFSGECLVDEAFASEYNSTAVNVYTDITGEKYNVITTVNGYFSVQNSANEVVDFSKNFDNIKIFVARDIHRSIQEIISKQKSDNVSDTFEVPFIYRHTENGGILAYSLVNGFIIEYTYNKDGSFDGVVIDGTKEAKSSSMKNELIAQNTGLSINAKTLSVKNYLDEDKKRTKLEVGAGGSVGALKTYLDKEYSYILKDIEVTPKEILESYLSDEKFIKNLENVYSMLNSGKKESFKIDDKIEDKAEEIINIWKKSKYYKDISKKFKSFDFDKHFKSNIILRSISSIKKTYENVLDLSTIDGIKNKLDSYANDNEQFRDEIDFINSLLDNSDDIKKVNDIIYMNENQLVGSSLVEENSLTLSINDGYSLKILSKEDGYYFYSNGKLLKLSDSAQNLVNTLLGNIDTSNKLMYNIINKKEIKFKDNNNTIYALSDNGFIIDEDNNIIVKFGENYFRVEQVPMEQQQPDKIQRFFNNVYVYEGNNVYDNSIALGGFVVADTVSRLLFLADNPNQNILMTKEVKDKILNSKDKLLYLSSIMHLDLSKAERNVDTSDKQFTEDNMLICK